MEKKKQVAIDSLKSNISKECFPEGTTMNEAIEMIFNNKDAIKAWIETYEYDMQVMDGDFHCDDLNEEYKIAIEYLNYRLTELN